MKTTRQLLDEYAALRTVDDDREHMAGQLADIIGVLTRARSTAVDNVTASAALTQIEEIIIGKDEVE